MGAPYYMPIKDRCRGRWPGILIALGMDPRYLTGKHSSCPLCNEGKDRWRFIDTNGDGTWICNSCGSDSGVTLVMKFLGVPFREAAQRIESVIGEARIKPMTQPTQDTGALRKKLNALWNSAAIVRHSDPVDLWLNRRGVRLDLYPSSLRTGHDVRYYDGRSAADECSTHPAMLAKVTSPDGSPATIHRTYLTWYGDKANVDTPRKLYSAKTKGSAIRLTPPGSILGVAEGVETALAAARLFGVPTWSVICANGIETFQPPKEVQELVIFGDNDANHVGQSAAHALAARFAKRKINVTVKIPDETGADWNDVLLGKGR